MPTILLWLQHHSEQLLEVLGSHNQQAVTEGMHSQCNQPPAIMIDGLYLKRTWIFTYI